MRGLPLVLPYFATLLLAACGQESPPASVAPTEPVSEAAAPIAETAATIAPQAVAPAARQALYGDLHIHTALSADAFSTGTRTLPDDAYRYAKGEAIAHGAGFNVQLKRPLDFAAVTDHSEYLGSMREFLNPASPLSRLPLAKLFASSDPVDAFKALMQIADDASHDGSLDKLLNLPEVNRAAWQQVIAAAERHNEPGRFTTLIGYEWTSTPDEINLHRNVIFRGSAVPEMPFSRLDSDKPEDLWRFLDEQRAQGIDAMAIPHNSNASDGMMWARTDSWGQPVDAAWARQRSLNEPIAEIVQIKGQSETHPLLSSEDEFANYEIWNTRMSGAKIPRASKPEGSYVRDALKTGLVLGASLGVNPFDFGVIGSSDTHNSASPIEEDNYHGKLTLLDGTAQMRADRFARSAEARAAGRITTYSAAGLAAVWADANTREAIYDALRRKESFATSGTRISLRFFAGWDLAPGLTQAPDFVAQAYAAGVAMGSHLPTASSPPAAPHFAALATKDPLGANLDRVQIIKGWLDAAGEAHEKIFDVAWAGERMIDALSGKLPPVGSTVDVTNASYTNTIGAAELAADWQDPEFDPAARAFYYVRVLEIPTPRWSTYDAVKLGTAPQQPAETQERAWSSPIWYTPAGSLPGS
ncbi:MAG: DUF3604 domain-containing protein [Gammaproteobacteria bacterium]|nr:DUF3604 domain-containing protein [Gammaproteobacteria bacterium]